MDWELWTSTNDGCGNSCDRQATFKVQMRDAAVELSKVPARAAFCADSQVCTRGSGRCRRCICLHPSPRACAAPDAPTRDSPPAACGSMNGPRGGPAERLHDLCAALHAAQVLVRRGPRGVPGRLHQPGPLLRGRLHLRQVLQNLQAPPGVLRARRAPQGAAPCQELLPLHAFSATRLLRMRHPCPCCMEKKDLTQTCSQRAALGRCQGPEPRGCLQSGAGGVW